MASKAHFRLPNRARAPSLSATTANHLSAAPRQLATKSQALKTVAADTELSPQSDDVHYHHIPDLLSHHLRTLLECSRIRCAEPGAPSGELRLLRVVGLAILLFDARIVPR